MSISDFWRCHGQQSLKMKWYEQRKNWCAVVLWGQKRITRLIEADRKATPPQITAPHSKNKER